MPAPQLSKKKYTVPAQKPSGREMCESHKTDALDLLTLWSNNSDSQYSSK